MFLLCVCLVSASLVSKIQGAAIPMWEFLSKDEKMSYLYSTFANQVEDFCETAPMRNCNLELMKYGLRKLKEMNEDHLDNMDPYQRGAHTLIWESFMDGHEMMHATKKPRPTTTAKPNSYEDQNFGDFGEASAKIETYNIASPPKGFIFSNKPPQFNVYSGIPEYKYPQSTQNLDPMDTYVNIPVRDTYGTFANIPLTGPMVVKVFPDGTPVKEDKPTPIPHDEDLKQYQRSKLKIPAV